MGGGVVRTRDDTWFGAVDPIIVAPLQSACKLAFSILVISSIEPLLSSFVDITCLP